ncbi:hypothetical protein [Hyphomicrobium sp.]|jgi:hypothetical protein|nr:hypothetical protein [Hyphomicrobium sp.]
MGHWEQIEVENRNGKRNPWWFGALMVAGSLALWTIVVAVIFS